MSKDYYQTLGIDRKALQAIAQAHGVKRLAVFGSFANGTQSPSSDIDMLAEWDPQGPGFQQYMGLIADLEQATNRKIDLTTPKALHWYIKDKVLQEAQDLL